MIRHIHIEDSHKFMTLMLTLDQETKHMMYEPGERKTDEKQMRTRIENMLHSGSMIFVSEEADDLTGFLLVDRGQPKRIQHTGYIVIGIKESHHRKGLGKALFEEAINWSRAEGIHRLSLTVKVDNHAGISLYEKIGFEIEGVKKDSMIVDGSYVDEYYMGILL